MKHDQIKEKNGSFATNGNATKQKNKQTKKRASVQNKVNLVSHQALLSTADFIYKEIVRCTLP